MAQMTAPDSIGGNSAYLSAENPGWYLMTVIDAHEGEYPAQGDEMKSMNGFSVECEVVGGDHAGKKYTLMLFDGKASHKDGGKSAAQKQFAFLVATDVCKPEQLGQTFDYDPTKSVGSNFFIQLVAGTKDDSGKQYLEINYSNCYHVDDPRAVALYSGKTPKVALDVHQRAEIANISAEYRHPSDYFEKLVAKNPAKDGKPAGSSSAPALDLNDL